VEEGICMDKSGIQGNLNRKCNLSHEMKKYIEGCYLVKI
jgi:hypothetical protein